MRRCHRASGRAFPGLRRFVPALVLAAAVTSASPGDRAPLLPENVITSLAHELSGTEARRHVEALTLHHRMRGSRGFAEAAAYVRDRAKSYGLEVEVVSLPADGTIFYGTQRSRPAWNAEFAELWELSPGDGGGDTWEPEERIASWSARPVTLAQDSASGKVAADLVDVGEGTRPEDYEDKEIRGRLVLAGAQPGPVARLAVDRYGASGIVSYAPNQRSAWWLEDETLVRWGHLSTFPEPRTFAFMVSLQQARSWQARLEEGERVRLQAEVRAGQSPGEYEIVTAFIPGRDPALSHQEIVFSCHLDHLKPGANDNASGCATILEVARAVAKLVREKKIEPPRRGLRFVWPPEIEGTIALLNARPEFVERTAAVIHMDMVGGDPADTKAIFHVTRSPASLPTFINDVAEAFGRFVNAMSSAHAGGADVPWPLVDPEGGKGALLAEMVDFTMGSDHQVWAEGSFRVPVIYMNDWPDRYIHTHKDDVGNIDPTKLLRAAFIGTASALYLSGLDEQDIPTLSEVMKRHAMERTARMLERRRGLDEDAARNLTRFHFERERRTFESIERFVRVPQAVREEASGSLDLLIDLAGESSGDLADPAAMPPSAPIYRRAERPKGPMSGFGYEYLEDHLKQAGLPEPRLLEFKGSRGSGDEYAYEALNLVDGTRTVVHIHADLAAIYGEVPIELVTEYFDRLEKIGILERSERTE